MPTAILADDETHLLDHLERQLASLWPTLKIIGRAKNGTEVLALIETHPPDVAFLDIRMPGLNGLQVAQQLPTDVHVVFVTAYDQYAIAAFEQAAVDYLLKPVSAPRLGKTVKKLRATLDSQLGNHQERANLERLIQQITASKPGHSDYLQWLRVGKQDTTELVAVADVVFLRSDNKYTSIFTATTEHLLRTSLKELEMQLDPTTFWRVHRSLIVNVNDIKSATRDLRGRFRLSLKRRSETLRTSQAYGHLFKQM